MANEPTANDIGLDGIDFVEFSSPKPEELHHIFKDFGFSRIMRHSKKAMDYYKQGDIHLFVNSEATSYSVDFNQKHGPSISAMGWRVLDAKKALATAVERGAREAKNVDYHVNGQSIPAIYGIGDSLIYFIEKPYGNYTDWGFEPLKNPDRVPSKGFIAIDHMTNNVAKGEMSKWTEFYKSVFGFTEVRYFDIRGAKTGLTSFALKSPCEKFCIPINEGTEDKSQINEYLREYKGPGIQHLAFLTDDILNSLDKMKGSKIKMLDIDDEYYAEVYDRVPNVTEDRKRIRNHNVLIDGDDDGYLLQIFTKNLIGPIFIEIIQRKNHYSFGEGNFGALFRSIEKDQESRGVL